MFRFFNNIKRSIVSYHLGQAVQNLQPEDVQQALKDGAIVTARDVQQVSDLFKKSNLLNLSDDGPSDYEKPLRALKIILILLNHPTLNIKSLPNQASDLFRQLLTYFYDYDTSKIMQPHIEIAESCLLTLIDRDANINTWTGIYIPQKWVMQYGSGSVGLVSAFIIERFLECFYQSQQVLKSEPENVDKFLRLRNASQSYQHIAQAIIQSPNLDLNYTPPTQSPYLDVADAPPVNHHQESFKDPNCRLLNSMAEMYRAGLSELREYPEIITQLDCWVIILIEKPNNELTYPEGRQELLQLREVCELPMWPQPERVKYNLI